MPRLLRYYQETIERQSKRLPLATPLSQAQQMFLETTFIGSQIADKYIFRKSATLFLQEVLVQHLIQPHAKICQEMFLPDLPLWIEIEKANVYIGGVEAQGFFLFDPYHSAVLKQSKNPLLRDSRFHEYVRGMGEWYQRCEIIGPQGNSLFNFNVVIQTGHSQLQTHHICPWKRCNFPKICQECEKLLTFWSMWSTLAQKMIERAFPTSPETEYPTVTEIIRRRVANPANPKKKAYEQETHTYHIVFCHTECEAGEGIC